METCAECGLPATCNPDNDCCARCERLIYEAETTEQLHRKYAQIALRNGIVGRRPAITQPPHADKGVV